MLGRSGGQEPVRYCHRLCYISAAHQLRPSSAEDLRTIPKAERAELISALLMFRSIREARCKLGDTPFSIRDLVLLGPWDTTCSSLAERCWCILASGQLQQRQRSGMLLSISDGCLFTSQCCAEAFNMLMLLLWGRTNGKTRRARAFCAA